VFARDIPDFDIDSLDLLQRILITTDGTVTDVLEVAFLEPIELVRLAVTVEASPDAVAPLRLEPGAPIMRRQVVLRGSRTGANYVYAETVIAADRLQHDFRQDLLAGRIPLGQLWISHRVETWKERPRVVERIAGDLGRHLDLPPDALLTRRPQVDRQRPGACPWPPSCG
jgi:chorismate-pyruvate lyase